MHGVRVLERDDVDVVVRRQVTAHPLDSHEVCNLRQRSEQLGFQMTHGCDFMN